MDELREHLEGGFLWETAGSAEEGFWPAFYLHNVQTNEDRWYKPTVPDKGWSHEGLIQESWRALLDPGEWQRWPETIEVEGTFKNGAIERQPYRLVTVDHL